MKGPSQGSCLDKTPLPNNDDLYIFLSNLDHEISSTSSSRDGTYIYPDISLIRAISRAKDWVAPYTTKNDGSLLTVYIRVARGDHYILHEAIDYVQDNVDFHSANYHLKIAPDYCSFGLVPNATV